MTLLISWIGVDDKKEGKSISSLYIAADSRYSWKLGGLYDYGIKVFGSTQHPEIFGFCGDVLFPSIILGQIIPQIDNGLLLGDHDDPETKNKKIFSYIESSLKKYPRNLLVGGTFTILHGTRFGKSFKLYKTYIDENQKLENDQIDLPIISTSVFSGGNGGTEFNSNWKNWLYNKNHNNYGTSRAVYHCLYQTLKTIKDPSTGGYPQIVGLYRNNNARIFGIIEDGKRYIYGKESSGSINSTNIEWRNENFERMNPETFKIFESAQRQPS